MTDILRVADMRSYLEANGWARRSETWRGATLWDHSGGYGALVPARDGMDDAAERSWELLQVLEKAEDRPAREIAEDIRSPLTDTQSIRTFPRDEPSGYVGLTAGLRALEGIRNLFAMASRAEVEGRKFAYHGNHPRQVNGLLSMIQLGPTKPGSYIFTTRIPLDYSDELLLDDGDPLPRRSSLRLFQAVQAAHRAVTAGSGNDSAFEEAVDAGVSANLCEALSDLGGTARERPFEIGFRWARAMPTDIPATTIAFGAETGRALRDAAKRLWRLDSSGEAQITGVVESLHDEPQGTDRWRVRVRGEMIMGGLREQRVMWLRLTHADYSKAVDAHVTRRTVRAHGLLSPAGRRIEMVVRFGNFEA